MSGFVFEGMTPALQAWVDYASQAGAAPEERARLRALVPPELLARWFWEQKVWRCRDASAVGEARVHTSPSGRYVLRVTTHVEGERSWAYAKGRVSRGGETVAEILRNFGQFPFAWLEDHASGHDYLIAGEDYQGQTVVELDTGRRADHLPPEASEGVGFCWADYTVSPSGRTLAVDGCYWACPYELRFVDLADPLAALPVITYIEDEASFTWLSTAPDTCDVTRSVEIYVPTGTPVLRMSDAEDEDARQREAAGEKGLWRMDAIEERWTRGPLAEHVDRQIDELAVRWPGRAPPAERLRNVRVLIERAPVTEQARLRARLAAWG